MERSVAIKKLIKLLGNDVGWRIDQKAPKQDEREAARAALHPAVAERTVLLQDLAERREAILAADAEYQRLHADCKAARERVDKLTGIAHRYRFTVGVNNGVFFLVKAQGDSWEEVI